MKEPTTPAEVAAFNAGVEAVLAAARRTATVLAATDRRRLHVGFAAAALDELAEAGRALLRGTDRREAA